MNRRVVEVIVIATGSLLLTGAMLVRLVTRGGPYFELPDTIVGHVSRYKHETRDALLLFPKVVPLIPRGAQVTCFHPDGSGQMQYDVPNFFAAVGALPRHSVQPPFTAGPDVPRGELVDYVIAVETPFDHPSYHVIAAFPEGRLYKVDR